LAVSPQQNRLGKSSIVKSASLDNVFDDTKQSRIGFLPQPLEFFNSMISGRFYNNCRTFLAVSPEQNRLGRSSIVKSTSLDHACDDAKQSRIGLLP
jgi:hypothetical protein